MIRSSLLLCARSVRWTRANRARPGSARAAVQQPPPKVGEALAPGQQPLPKLGGPSCSGATASSKTRRTLLLRGNSLFHNSADPLAPGATAPSTTRRTLLLRGNSLPATPATLSLRGNSPLHNSADPLAPGQQPPRKPESSIYAAAAASPQISGRICAASHRVTAACERPLVCTLRTAENWARRSTPRLPRARRAAPGR